LKKFDRLFQEAERISPPADLWRRIEAVARAKLRFPEGAPGAASRETHGFRIAASVALAAGLLGLAVHLNQRPAALAGAPAAEDSAYAAREVEEIVDPELMTWLSGLGEMDSQAEEAEEVL
jgi:hypothetical protein